MFESEIKALRAMLKAYEKALFAARVAHYRKKDPKSESLRRCQILEDAVTKIREDAASAVASGTVVLCLDGPLKADYEARAAGRIRLNAPPLEV